LDQVEQLHSSWGNMQVLHWNLDTIRNIWVIPTTSIEFGYLKQFHSNLGTIGKIWVKMKRLIQICIYY